MREHVRKSGCTPPYFRTNASYPFCYEQAQLKEALFDWFAYKKYPYPCTEIANIWTDLSTLKLYQVDNNITFPLHFEYPENFKLISQLKGIDFNSLIGYIGGYIGLLLGKVHFNYPYSINKSEISC